MGSGPRPPNNHRRLRGRREVGAEQGRPLVVGRAADPIRSRSPSASSRCRLAIAPRPWIASDPRVDDLPFVPAERFTEQGAARYRVPAALGPRLAGRAFAVVDDAINAGSAVAATCAELRAGAAEVRVLGALAMLGTHARRLGLPIEAIAQLDNTVWSPAECPLC